MILIGLTGSVGTGKTEVSKMFVKKNIPIFDSDKQVSLILQRSEIKNKIKKYFPAAFQDRVLIKKTLASIVFKDEVKLKILENIIYEKLKAIQAKWIRLQIMYRKKMVIFDVPLLFEKDNEFKYDLILVTTCSYSIQKLRVLKRKDWNSERFALTLKKQITDSIKKKKADIVIHSDRGKRYTFNKVVNISKFITFKKINGNKILRNFK